MKVINNKIAQIGLALRAGFCMVFLLILISSCSRNTTLGRVVKYGNSDIKDHKIFSKKEIKKGANVYHYPKQEANFKAINSKLERAESTAFIVIKKDTIRNEIYFGEHRRSDVCTSFSSAKSIVSLLVGWAIDQQHIGNVQDKIVQYLPELKTKAGFEDLTIEDLLLMRSPIKYGSLKDDILSYYHPNLRKVALEKTKVLDSQRPFTFNYNNYHPLLLGLILERSTKMTVAQILERAFWKKIGAEYDGSWSMDSDEHQFEKMESGINWSAIDYAKMGSLILHDGHWNNETIVSKSWIRQSTRSPKNANVKEYKGSFIEGMNIQYRYLWYNRVNARGDHEIFAIGKYGQFIFINPRQETVIVRFGRKMVLEINEWVDLFSSIAYKA